jgi:hypothetical protein
VTTRHDDKAAGSRHAIDLVLGIDLVCRHRHGLSASIPDLGSRRCPMPMPDARCRQPLRLPDAAADTDADADNRYRCRHRCRYRGKSNNARICVTRASMSLVASV